MIFYALWGDYKGDKVKIVDGVSLESALEYMTGWIQHQKYARFTIIDNDDNIVFTLSDYRVILRVICEEE